MTNPNVTVIIPIYNGEEYLQECLESIISQSLLNIEILCIDDGSTDRTSSILNYYSLKDKRVTVVHQKRQGPAVARNYGIRNAKGSYVAFMDCDDFYPSCDVLEKLYKVAVMNETPIAGGEFSIIFPDGRINEASFFREDPLQFGYCFEKEGIINYKDYQFDYGYHRFIYNTEFLISNNLYFPNLSRFQDPPFMVEAFSKAAKFYALKMTTYRYRCGFKEVHWDSQKGADLIEGILRIYDKAAEYGYKELQELMLKRMTVEYGRIVQRILAENRSAFSSLSYKLGLSLTFLPRKIIHLFDE